MRPCDCKPRSAPRAILSEPVTRVLPVPGSAVGPVGAPHVVEAAAAALGRAGSPPRIRVARGGRVARRAPGGRPAGQRYPRGCAWRSSGAPLVRVLIGARPYSQYRHPAIGGRLVGALLVLIDQVQAVPRCVVGLLGGLALGACWRGRPQSWRLAAMSNRWPRAPAHVRKVRAAGALARGPHHVGAAGIAQVEGEFPRRAGAPRR